MTEFKITKTGDHKTRDGRKIIINFFSGDINGNYQAHGVFKEGDFNSTWQSNGSYLHINGFVVKKQGEDIIGEWVEPISVDKWVNAYGNGSKHYYKAWGTEYDSELDAKYDDLYLHTCQLRYTEGKGMEIMWQGNLLEEEGE